MKRCPQCYEDRPDADFASRRDPRRSVLWCTACRDRYGGWQGMTEAERESRRRKRRGLRTEGDIRVRFVVESGNRKTGPIPVSTTSSETCPPSCALFGAGCYAEHHYLASHWRRVPAEGLDWTAFLDAVRALPAGQVWRHNEAGDLPGVGDELYPPGLWQLAIANRGRRGFTFTHKPLREEIERWSVKVANEAGFTVNLSADHLAHADELAALGIGPVVVTLPTSTPDRGTRTPAGRRVVVCPAETTEGMTCAACKLCAKPNRKAIVGFRAHGQGTRQINERLTQLRLER